MDRERPSAVRRLLSDLVSALSKLSPAERQRNLDEGATFVEERREQPSKPATSDSAPAEKVRIRAAR